jgi:hypothetical protein
LGKVWLKWRVALELGWRHPPYRTLSVIEKESCAYIVGG